jgi:hypothetical protein
MGGCRTYAYGSSVVAGKLKLLVWFCRVPAYLHNYKYFRRVVTIAKMKTRCCASLRRHSSLWNRDLRTRASTGWAGMTEIPDPSLKRKQIYGLAILIQYMYVYIQICGIKIAVWLVLHGLDGTGGRRPGVAGLAAVCLPEIGGSAVRDRQTQTVRKCRFLACSSSSRS